MRMALEEEIERLKLSQEDNGKCDDDDDNDFENYAQVNDLVDVTTIFFELGRDLQPQTIIKDPGFNLFEGTHSLEVNNKKLDSSLICLSENEAHFDCNIAYGIDTVEKLRTVTAIVDKLTRFLVCWLNEYQTLPTTVLSCRYVEYLLINSSKEGRLTFLQTGDQLYDQVLCDAIYGICYFAKFVQKLLKAGVIFEEEDLNFNNMGLDFLSYVESKQEILDLLQRSIEYIKISQGSEGEPLLHLLSLICSLISIEDTLDKYSADVSHLNQLIKEANYLNDIQTLAGYSSPPGCFSMGIQKRLSNQFPPKGLVIPSWNYTGFVVMAQDLKLVLKVEEADTMLEAMQLANFFNKLTQRHVVARALFPLFFIRDDQTILGRFTTMEFVCMHLREFSLMSTTAAKESPSEMEPVLQEAMNVLFEWYQNTAQNTSRYRQGYNRQLLLWDALQAQMESVEFELESRGIYDQVEGSQAPVPLLPYSSWAFFMKVTAMVEYVMKGFDLDVYKPFESYTMFWYSYYLSYQLESCLEKVHRFIEAKINAIHSLSKKAKKSKNEEKKAQLKAQHRHLMDNEMDQLRTNKRYFSYLFMHCTIMKSLSLAQVLQFAILKSVGVIDNKSPSDSKFTNDVLLYKLRFKSFSSIGVPEVLPYEILQSTLNDFLIKEPMFSQKLEKAVEYMKKELQNASIAIETIRKCITIGDNNGLIVTGTRLVKEEALDYYNKLQKSVQAIELNCKVITSKLGKSKSLEDVASKYEVTLSVPEGCSTFFPLMELRERGKSTTSGKRDASRCR